MKEPQPPSYTSPASPLAAFSFLPHPFTVAVVCYDGAGGDYTKLRCGGCLTPFLWVGRGEMIAQAAVERGVRGGGIVKHLLLF